MKKLHRSHLLALLSCAAISFFPVCATAQDDLLDEAYQEDIQFEDMDEVNSMEPAVAEDVEPILGAPGSTVMMVTKNPEDSLSDFSADTLSAKIMNAKQETVSISDALGYGLYTNPEYGVVANNRRATDEELRQAQALYLPSLDFRADGGYEVSDDPSTRSRGEDEVEETRYDSSLTLTQMLFDGFETFYENKRQKARVASATHRVREVSQLVGLDIIEAYLEVLRQRKLLNIARENVAEHVRIFDQILESAEAGRTTDANVEQVKARVAAARAQEADVRQALRNSEATYIAEVGKMPGDLTMPVIPYDFLEPSVEEEVKVGLDQSPTLDVFEADIRVANAEYKGAKATYYPALDLELNARQGDDLGGVDGRDRSATALVVMNWNLYRGGGDTARVREQINREAQAKEERAESARGVANEIRQTWASMVAAGERARDFSVQAEANSKVVEAYKDQFDLNRRTLLDVLDSQNELFVSKSNIINSEFLEMFAVYRLLALKGELLDVMGVQMPTEANIDTQYSYYGDVPVDISTDN